MNRLSNLICLFLLSFPFLATAQQRVTLSGYVRDEKSNESLISATIYIKELGIGAQTNNYGFYSISMPAGQYSVLFSYVGYATLERNMQILESRTFDADLKSQREISEIVTTAGTSKATRRSFMIVATSPLS